MFQWTGLNDRKAVSIQGGCSVFATGAIGIAWRSGNTDSELIKLPPVACHFDEHNHGWLDTAAHLFSMCHPHFRFDKGIDNPFIEARQMLSIHLKPVCVLDLSAREHGYVQFQGPLK